MATPEEEDRRPPDDLPGHVLKPDPLTARTMRELEELMRTYWLWSGRPSTRKVAKASGGVFCHSTVSKLLYGGAKTPRLSLDYLCGCIRGCGGDLREEQRWATAWRRINVPQLPGANGAAAGEGGAHEG
ncbi:hypothetical protein AB0L25_36830 [Spirillospora sp. NPDC052242]